MGDVMDRRKYVSYKTATDFRQKFINRFEELGIDLHITIGNHDTYYKNTSDEIYWNDCDDPKGFHIFDTETRELERVVNKYTLFKKIYYDDSDKDWTEVSVDEYKETYVKLIVVNKKDLYGFDQFVDRLLKADAYEVKIIEDFSELDASNVSDDIVENAEDTMTLLERYIDDLSIDLDKGRLKNTMKTLYNEAQDLEL